MGGRRVYGGCRTGGSRTGGSGMGGRGMGGRGMGGRGVGGRGTCSRGTGSGLGGRAFLPPARLSSDFSPGNRFLMASVSRRHQGRPLVRLGCMNALTKASSSALGGRW